MKQLIIASYALTFLTGCWWSSDWDEAKQRAACENAHPDSPAEAKKCYDAAYLAFGRDKAKQTNDLKSK